MPEIGTKAPDFTLIDKDGKNVSLSDFLGNKLLQIEVRFFIFYTEHNVK